MKKLISLTALLALAACDSGADATAPVATPKTTDATIEVAGPPGPAGPMGATGPAGPQGPQGVVGPAGQGMPQLRLKDLNGSVIPGTLISPNTIYLASENVTASYGSYGGNGSGLQRAEIYFPGLNCTGTMLSTFSVIGTVFANPMFGGKWEVTATTTAVPGTIQSRRDTTGACFNDAGSQNGTLPNAVDMYSVIPYTGTLPLVAPAPYTTVLQ